MRVLAALVLLVLLAFGGAWVVAGRAAPPVIEIRQPVKQLGQTGNLEVAVTAPAGSLTRLDARLEQGANRFPLFSMPGDQKSTLTQETPDRVKLTRKIAKSELPALKAGPARVVVSAARKGLFGLRTVEAESAQDVVVRLEPPRVSVVSMHHYINHGGSEMIVYRATPADVSSGVRVGDIEYQGFPAANAGVTSADPALKVAFFALSYDQDLDTPIRAFARDEVGNEATAEFDFKVFPKPFRKSTIPIDDRFLSRVVPAILEHSPDLKVNDPNDLTESFLTINRDLRRTNGELLMGLGKKSSPKMLWKGPFQQMTNSQVESAFADQRTYMYQGKEIDRQVHLGFDLAVTTNVPVKAANDGVVAYADYLGIYGNCVVIDHGMGVESLYGHMSSLDVKAGDSVTKDQTLGRSGMTGLAGGDHVHFTMLVGGRPVSPLDWWSKQWIEDRILRKLREAGAPASAGAAAQAASGS